MMARFPFSRFPYNNYYYNYYSNYNKMNTSNSNKYIYENEHKLENQDKKSHHEDFQSSDDNSIRSSSKASSKYNNFGPIRFSNPFSNSNLEEPIFEVLGIKLYLDDIIILGILFFLYKEEVQDEMLFLSLILLLLT